MIETRPDIPGYYKGFVYCRSPTEATKVKTLLDKSLLETFRKGYVAVVKRGCSEYSLKFPKYGQISDKGSESWNFPPEWEIIEREFDNEKSILAKDQLPSLTSFSLSDLFIIENWIDYAKGIGGQTASSFSIKSSTKSEIYLTAKKRIRAQKGNAEL
jgi:hypothetical protein